ncbi:uncharacterized protein K02A2.6-like [Oryzias latipes]|uniref:uncharacterized protein K02A2.6-like n=1 Tax=Oryzias latipes TaxID=8090 RepID=UPI000CE25E0E|nr:uncharacterized protein K02A2.6-like [Oryzias latipes]
MPAPTDVKGVQRLVGMINYLAKFYKHLSDDCEPLRQLTHKDSLWEWSDVQEDAFKRLKEKITQVPVLKYYSPEEELTLQCDASETGLGAALTQKGRDMLLADTLSRAYLQESNNKSQTELETECVNMVEYVPVSTESMEKIRTGTKTDHKLQILIETIQKGWPTCKKEVPTEITQFQSMQDELSTQDGLVFKGERVVIPDALQAEITQRIHSTHIGTEGCLRRARDCIYWHGMNDHIKKYIAKCDICRKVDAKQQKETLRPHELTDRPWTKVGTDLFNFDGREYLITVDYYSNFWDIDHLPDTKSSTVIRKLKAHFARQGIPEVVFSDNGP